MCGGRARRGYSSPPAKEGAGGGEELIIHPSGLEPPPLRRGGKIH